MAEQQAEKKPEAPAAAPAPAPEAANTPTGGMLKSTPMLMGIVMIIEAIVLFAGIKFLGGSGPGNAHGAQLAPAAGGHDEHGKPTAAASGDKTVEVSILHFRPTNERTGRKIQYDLEIVATAKAENEPKLKEAIQNHAKMIQHRLRTIIAQSDPDKLGGGSEPGLETLRRQVKCELEEVMGEGMIDQILVPTCTPVRMDF